MKKIILIIITFSILSLGKESLSAQFNCSVTPVQGMTSAHGGYVTCDVITGTAPDSYPLTAQGEFFPVWMYKDKTIYIMNTGPNSLDYKVVLHPSNTDTSTWTLVENSLSAGGSAIISIPEVCYKISIFMKNSSAGNSTSFKILANGLF